MAEPPPAPPQPLPPLPQPPPVPQNLVVDAPQGFSPTASSTLSRRRLMAEPPAALPQALSHGPVAAAPISLSSTASSMPSAHGLAPPTSPSGYVAQNPRIGDSGEVEIGALAPSAEALPKINSSVGALAAAPPPQISMPDEENGMADECGSSSLSAICARMIQSCTYTVEVKVCGSGTKINGDSTFSWQIIEGTRTSMKDLLACIAGTFSFALCSEDNIFLHYIDSISGKNIFLHYLRRAPGRPKVQRHKSGAENSKGKGKKGQHQCPICKAYGHRWQSCKDAAPEALEAYAEVAKQKRDKRKKKPITKAICTTSDQATDGTQPLLPCPSENETALALLSCPSDVIQDDVANTTSSKTISKSRRSKAIYAAPDSPAMGTRSKKRAAPNNQAMASRSKKKLKV